MVHPLWLLLPWALVALSAGVKFWRLTSAWRKRGNTSADRNDCAGLVFLDRSHR